MSVHQVLALRRSGLLQICVALLAKHYDDGTGACAGCTAPLAVCVPRRNGHKVIATAGLNPAKFDTATVFDGCRYVRAELAGGTA